jgi:hypothetical protein
MPIPDKYVVHDLAPALSLRAFPTIVTWNRLEGRPRRDDFSRALKAEVRDALWMLCKQWQIGEFRADDAGSPVIAKVRLRSSPVVTYEAGGVAEPLEPTLPLEAKVERRAIAWSSNGHKLHLDLRAQLARHWCKLLDAEGLAGTYASRYLARWPITVPGRTASSDQVHADRRGWQQLAALAGRMIDGGDLFVHVVDGGAASDGIALDAPQHGTKLDVLGLELVAWFRRLYLHPESSAWKPSYLEHQFTCVAAQADRAVALEAEEFPGGHLGWYSFDRGRQALEVDATQEQLTTMSFLPTPIAFEGMPDPRWWALEDRKTDFGAVKPSTTDLAQLLLVEFGLVYSNDWFMMPLRVPASVLARIEGLAITNTFGERFWVDAAGRGRDDNWHRWAMFQISANDARRAADPSLLVPPTTSRTLDGKPLEQIELARDEVANMVWAVERTIPSISGAARSGRDAARDTAAYHRDLVDATAPPPIGYTAPIHYLAQATVPEHWIPFVPTHVPGSNREIQLQRSRMLRIIAGAPTPPPKIPPRTTLIREGLEASPAQPYFVHEEEIPRAGTLLELRFRRARWVNGEAPVWLGVRRQTGRGERGSGIAFDSIVANPFELSDT